MNYELCSGKKSWLEWSREKKRRKRILVGQLWQSQWAQLNGVNLKFKQASELEIAEAMTVKNNQSGFSRFLRDWNVTSYGSFSFSLLLSAVRRKMLFLGISTYQPLFLPPFLCLGELERIAFDFARVVTCYHNLTLCAFVETIPSIQQSILFGILTHLFLFFRRAPAPPDPEQPRLWAQGLLRPPVECQVTVPGKKGLEQGQGSSTTCNAFIKEGFSTIVGIPSKSLIDVRILIQVIFIFIKRNFIQYTFYT